MSNTPNSAEPNEIFETLKRHGMSDIPHDEFVSIFYPSLQDAVEECAAKDAKAFAEWIANNDYEWSHRAVKPRMWTQGFDESKSYTTAELYEEFKRYKEGKG